jgi:DNA-binding transcriptional ArsR family regulator
MAGVILRRMPNQSKAMDRVFHALADASRRSVVQRLSRAPATVSELADPLRMALPSVMQHLRVLEESGLIRTEKVGRVRTCHIELKALTAAEQWIAAQRTMWDQRLDRLGALFAADKSQLPGGK